MGSGETQGIAMDYRPFMVRAHSHNPEAVLRAAPHTRHHRSMLSLSVPATLQCSNTLFKDKVKSSGVRMKLLRTLVAAVLVAAALLLAGAAWRAALLARSLAATVSAWQAAGPHTTSVGQLRHHLTAGLWWLGLLAPGAPRDPLKECGVQAGADDWWTVFWRLREARVRLACLQQSIVLAREEHEAFRAKLVLAFVLLAAGLVGWALRRQGNNDEAKILSEATVGAEARAADQEQSAEAPRVLHLSRRVSNTTCTEEAFPAADQRQQHAGGGSGLKEACTEGLVPEWQGGAGMHDSGSGDEHLETTPSVATTGSSLVPDQCVCSASWPADPQQQWQSAATTPDVAWVPFTTWPPSLPRQQKGVSSVTAVPWASGANGLLKWREERDEEAEAGEACGVEESLGGRAPCLTRGQLAGALEGVMELGRGTHGAVWLVRYWGALAATKSLLGAAPVALLLEEASLLLELDGAGGMPRVLAVCAAPPTLVLEYVGSTYDHFLDGCSVGGLVDSLVSIAERLAELHAHGVVHNDLKANNITFTGPRDAPLFHVIDCGLACRVGQEANCCVSEGDEDLYPWVAPEVGRSPVFPSGDVYSLGVLVRQVLPLLSDDLPEVTARLQQLADSCTERQPWQRPPLALVAATLRVLRRDLPPPAAARRVTRNLWPQGGSPPSS